MAVQDDHNTAFAVRQSADLSLQRVLLRTTAMRQARTLLRAGSPAAMVPSSLLRSSDQNLETGRNHLLRAVK